MHQIFKLAIAKKRLENKEREAKILEEHYLAFKFFDYLTDPYVKKVVI